MDDKQLERFGDAVEKKKEEADEASRAPGDQSGADPSVSGDQQSLTEHGRPQDVRDPRKKNAGHGKTTADKWNQ
jgi:hypothetical protein